MLAPSLVLQEPDVLRAIAARDGEAMLIMEQLPGRDPDALIAFPRPLYMVTLLHLWKCHFSESATTGALDRRSTYRRVPSNRAPVTLSQCISDNDPVGQLSRRGWKSAAESLPDSSRRITFAFDEALSVEALRNAIAKHEPDVLVISAHGFHAPESNAAGLVIGSNHSLGMDLGTMPPLVILSACHSGPRDGGPVAITDLLIRAGATAVISPLVPVRAIHNSMFMVRFLHYMSEAVGGIEDHRSVLEVWHRLQANTVIIDILYGNDRLRAWGFARVNGRSPVEEFMGQPSAGRLSVGHLYRDAEAVLLEIAADQGNRDKVAGWLRTPGYLPESMMYTLVGDPARIRLQPSHLTVPPLRRPAPIAVRLRNFA